MKDGTMHALILNNAIQSLGNPPAGARRLDSDAWVTPPADGWTPALLAACGWLPVTGTARPADTATHTHDWSVTLPDGTPTETWTPRPWTAEEIATRQEQAARLDALADRVARIEAHLWPPEPDPTTPTGVYTWAAHGGIAPAGALLLDGGRVWRNVSKVPLTAPPSGFPGWTDAQLAHLWAVVVGAQPDPEPDPTYPQWRGEWSADAEYVIGDHVTRGGIIYRCLVAHGAAHAGTWGPPATGVWTDVGDA